MFREDEAGLDQPIVREDHAGVELVGDEPDLDFGRALRGVGGYGVFPNQLYRRGGRGREGDEVAGATRENENGYKDFPETGHQTNSGKHSGTEEGADVLANTAMDGDGESAVPGNLEGLAVGNRAGGLGAVNSHLTGAGTDFHQLRRGGVEVVGARKNKTQGLFRSIGEVDGMGDDFPIKIDVGDGIDGDVGELLHELGKEVKFS